MSKTKPISNQEYEAFALPLCESAVRAPRRSGAPPSRSGRGVAAAAQRLLAIRGFPGAGLKMQHGE